jgi:hypothetical protein
MLLVDLLRYVSTLGGGGGGGVGGGGGLGLRTSMTASTAPLTAPTLELMSDTQLFQV